MYIFHFVLQSLCVVISSGKIAYSFCTKKNLLLKMDLLLTIKIQLASSSDTYSEIASLAEGIEITVYF